MAIVEKSLFGWRDADSEGDLYRLRMMMELLPDEILMKFMELFRGRGRNDYPIRPVWNSILAGILYEHKSIESLRRELLRNAQLREVCGFDPLSGAKAVPTSRAYSSFLKQLLSLREHIEVMFDELVSQIKQEMPDYGHYLGIDSKGVNSAGKPNTKLKRDGRRDLDADWGKKEYRGERQDGSTWEKIVKWFGYKIHILADTEYEIPIAYKVTRASIPDTGVLEELVEETAEKHPKIIDDAKELSADKGYDSEDNNKDLWDKHGIKPLIDIRNMWKDGKGQTRPLYPDRADNIVYDYKGNIYCHCPETDECRSMAYQGFEKKRESLKYRCPAEAYGFKCKGKSTCSTNKYGRIVRIPIETDRRIFTPIARSSYAWQRQYKRRTAVERVNSRLDLSFGFEHHFIRGQAKMEVRVGLAMVVMLGLVLGSIRANKKNMMRSLVKPRKPPDKTVVGQVA
ncbi:MAG: transposase [Candidatus Omnitrophica bacterium]|nr:transposase [Candidatus Omnitrophota bacterium]